METVHDSYIIIKKWEAFNKKDDRHMIDFPWALFFISDIVLSQRYGYDNPSDFGIQNAVE